MGEKRIFNPFTFHLSGTSQNTLSSHVGRMRVYHGVLFPSSSYSLIKRTGAHMIQNLADYGMLLSFDDYRQAKARGEKNSSIVICA